MIKDQAARDRARFRLDKNVVVEAGAGTGKTTLLTDRLLFTLLCGPGPSDITRIVALTFTEKAAGEIKVRLSARLADILAAIDGRELPEGRKAQALSWLAEAQERFRRTPSEIRRDGEAAVLAMDRAMIGTIHHFAAHILRLFPLEAGVDPSFDVDDGRAFEEHFEAEWALWLDEELGLEPARSGAWLEVLQLATLEDLGAMARELCGEGARQGGIGATPAMKERLRALAREFSELPLGKPEPGGTSSILRTIDGARARLKGLCEGLENPAALPAFEPRPKLAAAAWPKKWAGLPGREVYDEGLGIAMEVSAVSESLVRKAAALLLPFCDRFRELYARRGQLGYDGLLTAARRLVRGDLAVREELKSRFDALLIDEFQDTDPLQGELLLYLAEEKNGGARRWADIRFAPGRLFIVGDPKQSIYRFRGADIRAYARFTGSLLAQGAEKCDLQTNFRSHEGIVGPVNAVFARAMTAEAGLQPGYIPIFPKPGGRRGRAGVEFILFEDAQAADKPVLARRRQDAEASWMSSWIDEQVRRKNYVYRDIAVLLRTSSPLGAYLEGFKAAGIPYAVETDSYFYGTQEVIDLVNLLRALDDPEDRLSLAGLLRSPLCLLDDRDIYELARAKALHYREDPPGAPERLKSLFKTLRGLRERAGREPLGDFIARVLEDTRLIELCAAAYHRDQTVSNLMKFGRMASEAGEGRGATLKEFIARVCRSMEEASDEGESPLADEQLDAVRILTIHKSKGLEYPVVLLPNMTAGAGGGREKPAAAVDWSEDTVGLRLSKAKAQDAAMAMIERAQSAREEREYVRLLYVAMTRAKERLLLLGDALPGRASSLASILAGAAAWPGEFPASRVDVNEAVALRPRKGAEKKAALDLKKLEGLWARRGKERQVLQSQSLFTAPTRYLKEAPKEPSFREEPAGPSPEASLVGRLCHRVLESWDFRGKRKLAPELERAASGLRREDPLADWRAITRQSRSILESFLGSPAAAELARSEILGREIPFVSPQDGAVLRGSIDVLYRHAGSLWVGDYKTGLKTDPGRYAAQGRAYVSAVTRAAGEACGFKLLFLRTGEVIEASPPAIPSPD